MPMQTKPRLSLVVVSTAFLILAVSVAPSRLQAAIRVVSYNTLDNPTTSAENTDFQTIMEAIGIKSVNGVAKRVDVIAVQEQTGISSTSGTAVDMADQLNALYGVTSYTSMLTNNGFDRTGIVYDTSTLSLLGTAQTSGGPNGRFTLRAQFRPVGYTSPDADLYVYSAHLKADDGPSDIASRAAASNVIVANADALGADANVIFAGDFNYGDSFEAGYANLQGGNGNTSASDPLQLASWPSLFEAEHMTQSTRNVSFGGGAGSGMDDRFDLQIISDDLLDGEGLSYIGPTSTGLESLDHSYQAFGNDGTSYNQAITTPSIGRSQPANVLQALHDFSDHLPVVADYQLPAWMDVVVGAVPTEVDLGEAVSVDVMIENIANALNVNGADELDYSITVSGDLLIGGDPMGEILGLDPATGGAQMEQIELDTSTLGAGKSGTITVTSSSQAVEAGSFSMPISFSVVEPVPTADFDDDGDVDNLDLISWDLGVQFGLLPLDDFGDADFDADADLADLMIWQQQYTGPLPAATSVPEPSSVGLVSLVGLITLGKSRIRTAG
ncbi:MAG: hypothetical protein AAGA92_02035 [Planctomycetota bacterium]